MVIRILLIDDEEAYLEIAKVFLEQEQGFKVDTSLSAQEALDKLKRDRFDVIISDYQMHGMNGIELLKKLKSEGNPTPFILFTGRGREDVAIDALNNGASFYLQKGGDAKSQFAELVNIIKISARQAQAEDMLRQEKDRAQQYIDLAGVMLLALDKDGKVTLVNDKGCEILGYEGDQILGKSWFDNFLKENRRDEVKVIFNRLMRGELEQPKHQFTNLVLCRGGVEKLIAFTNALVKNEKGEIVGTLSSGVDITEREQAEVALRVSLAKYGALFESLPLGLTISDKEGNIVESNREAERLLGLSREDQAKRRIDGREWRIVRRDGSPMPASEYASVRAMKENRRVSDVEMGIVKDDGPPTWINVTAAPIPLAGYGVAIAYTDITERRLAEHHVNERMKELRAFFSLAEIVARDGITLEEVYQELVGVLPESWQYPEIACARIAIGCEEFTTENYGESAWKQSASIKVNDVARGTIEICYLEERPEEDEGPFLKEERQLIEALAERLGHIIEHKRMTEALRESEERYHKLVEGMLEGVAYCQMLYDDHGHPADWIYLNVNSNFATLTGLHDIVGKRVTEAIPGIEKSNPELFEIYGRVASSGNPEIFESDIKSLMKWLKISVFCPEKDHFVAVFEDITERKKSEVVIAESLEKRRELESIIDKSPAIAFIWKHVPEWSVVFVSSNIKQFGYMPEDFTSRRLTYADLVHPEDMKRVFGESEAYAKKGVSEFTQEYRILTKSGDVRWVDDRTVILRNTAGESIFHQGIIFDITEQRRVERALRQANKKLALLGSITRHDAINQLSVLMAWLDIAKEVGKDLPTMEHLTRIQESARILQTQLEFTAEYQEMGVKQPQWINLRDAADAGTEGIDLGAVSIKYDLKGAEIFADPMLEKMFHNLVDNSLRHGEKVTQIRLYCKESNEGLVIICEDDGVGVPVDEKERIFERSFGKHTGLGLYLVREILGITGIVVKETGEPGTGARFEVIVPAGNYRFGHPGQ